MCSALSQTHRSGKYAITTPTCRLSQHHLDKGDQTSAMVTLEWTMKNHFFQKWGFPFEESAYLYEKLDRSEEARDTARLALRQPWWSVGDLPRCVPEHVQLCARSRWRSQCDSVDAASQ